MGEMRDSETQKLAGGELCLDFANTVNGHKRLPHHEYLQDYRDLVLWGKHTGVLDPDEAGRLLKKVQANPAKAEAVYRQGVELRETIFDIFSMLAQGRRVEKEDLERLNATWREGMGHARLVPSKRGFDLGWDEANPLARPLWTVVNSAIKLLSSAEVQQVRQCAGEGCDWLFVDASRNHLRKWCSMEECGNRAKMKRRKLKLDRIAT